MSKSVFVILTFIIFSVLYADTIYEGNIDIPNGTYDIEFKLYSSISSRYEIWSEIHNDVSVNDGSYSVVLGSINPLIIIDSGSMYLIEVYVNGVLIGERREINLLSLIDRFAREMEVPDSLSGETLEELTPSLELGNGTDDVIVVEGSDFGIGLAAGADATGRLEVRGDEVRVWDGSSSVEYADGEGDLFVEDQLEVDNTVYATHYRDNTGGNLLNAGKGIYISEDSDGSWTISAGNSKKWTFDSDLESWISDYHCGYSSYQWAWNSDGGNGTAFAVDPSSSSSQTLKSPVLNVADENILFSYRHRFETEACCAHGYLAYRLDGGAWVQFTPSSGSYIGIEDEHNDPLFGGCADFTTDLYYGSMAYSTHSGSVSTTGARTIEFMFVFTSEGSSTGTGWFIDEVSISGIYNDDNDWTGAGSGTLTAVNITDNVGIGTSSVTGKLDVRGDEVRIWDGDASCSYATGVGDLFVEKVIEVDNSIYVPRIYDENNTDYYSDPAGTNILNIIDSRYYITNSGSSYGGAVVISDNLVPTTSNNYDLGSSTNYWHNVYSTVYHDQNNPFYYCNPNSWSEINILDIRQYLVNNGSSYDGHLAVDCSIVPVDSTYSLGIGTDSDWDDLWLSGMIYINGSEGTEGQVLKTSDDGNIYWGDDDTGTNGSSCFGEVTFGSTRSGENPYPWYGRYNYSRSSSLILKSELSPCDGGQILAVSLLVKTDTGTHTFTDLKIYMKETSATSLSTSSVWSPGLLVNHTASMQFNSEYTWYPFAINPPFSWNENNLQISFQHGYTSYSPYYPLFAHDTAPGYLQINGYSNSSFPLSFTRTTYRPLIRLTFAGSSFFREREVELSTPQIDVSSINLDCGYVDLLDDEVRVSYSEIFSEALGCRTPVVLTNALEPGKNVYISNVDQNGFTVHTDDSSGTKFNWTAMIKPVEYDKKLYEIESSEEYMELSRELYENPSVHTYEEWNILFKELGVDCAPIRKDVYNARVYSTPESSSSEK